MSASALHAHRDPFSLEAVSACLDKYTGGIDSAAVENEQEEEIESMQSAVEVEAQASETREGEHVLRDLPVKIKYSKLDVREASLKAASAQIVVTNTLNEYARFANLPD